ncbi:Gti1/Pac2 family-domain-containing protein [Xylariaceae sp. FL0016]|nr:Gti1/Pac2 family-domain-containing protein [Xylariaceae sp. FL0016]
MANQSSSNPLTPTFRGYISSTMDALILFESCLTGRLMHVPRRPHDRERGALIRSGHVFIYEEHSSGIKRWTDGVSWSPSRILNNFLLYRELDKPFVPGEKKRAIKRDKPNGISKTASNSRSNSVSGPGGLPMASHLMALDSQGNPRDDSQRALVGSLVDSYQFKADGLVKKTISVSYRGVTHHLVSYYTLTDVVQKKLKTPTESPNLADITPRPALISSGSFRSPVDDDRYGSMIHPDLYPSQMPPHSMPYGTIGGLGSRSMSVPHMGYSPSASSWGNAQHYALPGQSYPVMHGLPPPMPGASSFVQSTQFPTTFEHGSYTNRIPSQSSSFADSPISSGRRHSVLHTANGYPNIDTTERSHMSTTPSLLSNGTSLASNHLPTSMASSMNPSYANGTLFGTSAAAAAAASAGSSHGYEASSSAPNLKFDDEPAGPSTSFDDQFDGAYHTSDHRSMADVDHSQQSTGFDSQIGQSYGPTPPNLTMPMNLQHGDSASTEAEWSMVGNEYQSAR